MNDHKRSCEVCREYIERNDLVVAVLRAYYSASKTIATDNLSHKLAHLRCVSISH